MIKSIKYRFETVFGFKNFHRFLIYVIFDKSLCFRFLGNKSELIRNLNIWFRYVSVFDTIQKIRFTKETVLTVILLFFSDFVILTVSFLVFNSKYGFIRVFLCFLLQTLHVLENAKKTIINIFCSFHLIYLLVGHSTKQKHHVFK